MMNKDGGDGTVIFGTKVLVVATESYQLEPSQTSVVPVPVTGSWFIRPHTAVSRFSQTVTFQKCFNSVV